MNSHKFHYFSRSRSLKWKFFLVFLCGFVCFSLGVTAQTRLWNSRLETAQAQYGLWQAMRQDINEKDKKLLGSHALVETVGTEEIYGTLETESGSFLAGSGDGPFYDLANFHFIQGRQPQNGQEAVVESRVLDQAGLPYVCGQKISGRIQGQESEWAIAGIIDNYSASWMNGDSQPAVFVGPESGLQPLKENLFVRAEDPAVIGDLKEAMPLLVRNVHVKELWEPFSEENAAWTLLMILAAAGSGLLILIVFRRWLASHRQDIQVLKGLGVSSRKIGRDLGCAISGPAVIAGMAAMGIGIWNGWPWIVLGGVVLVMSGEVLILYGLLYGDIRGVPAVENVSDGSLSFRRCRRMKRVSSRRLGWRFLQVHGRQLAAACLMVSLMASALFGTLLSLMETWQYQSWMQEKPDYILSLDPPGVNAFETGDSLEKLADKLKSDDRFSSVETGFLQLSGWSLPVKEGSLLEQIRNDESLSEDSRDSILYPAAMTPSGQQMTGVISRQDLDFSDVEDFDASLWNSGQGVILFVPDLAIEDGELLLAEEVENRDHVLKETAWKTGDEITLTDPSGKEIRIRIAGILRRRPETMRFDSLMGISPAYIFFVPPAFLEHPVNRLHLGLADNQEGSGADVSVSSVAAAQKVYLTNERADKQRAIHLLKNEETLYGILAGALFVALGFVLFFVTRKLENQLTAYSRSLEMAGMPPKKAKVMKRTAIIAVTLFLVAGIAIAGGLYFMIHSRFPANADLLANAMPFLFVNGNPSGIFQLDLGIALWLLPAVIILVLFLAVLAAFTGKDRKKES